MTKLLLRVFIGSKEKESFQARHEQYGHFANTVGLIVNLLLFSLKIFVSIISGSLSILADAVNNLSDAFSTLVSFVSFKISAKPPDKKHPFGHARAEYIFTSVIALIVVVIGWELFVRSIGRIQNPQAIIFSWWSLGILLFSIVAKLWLSVFYTTIAKKIESEMLRATAVDSRSDSVSTFVVALSLIFSRFTTLPIDGILGIVVSVLIIVSGVRILLDIFDRILGKAPSAKTLDNIQNFVLSYDGVKGVHDLIVHEYGAGHIFASIHVEVDAEVNVLISHSLIDKIEDDILEKLNVQLVAHMDPLVLNDPKVEYAKKETMKIIKNISDDLEMHDFRLVETYNGTNILFDIDVPVDCLKSDNELAEIIINKIKEKSNRYNPIITIDRNYVKSVMTEKHL